jgi:plasmid stabilization system protein ParE
VTNYRVVFTPEAMDQLSALFTMIARASSGEIAGRYVDAVVARCQGLRDFPLRGARRDDIRPGLRLTHYRRRTAILFRVSGDEVAIIGVFHGGQDYGAAL